MVSVASLLNPLPPTFEQYRSVPSPSPGKHGFATSSPLPPSKRQKMVKDGAIFIPGKPRMDVRYPPYETRDAEAVAEYERFRMNPRCNFGKCPRQIPYKSTRRDFFEKTGRESFEVFQIEFLMPEDGDTQRPYVILWDYNNGLVRMTPFFKCHKFAKTTPSKMYTGNHALRGICHSITGGSLTAQGYWVPFEAAKAMAATFCYDIRYVLIPLFGPDFPQLCLRRGDPGFERYVIDRKIIQKCSEEAKAYREETLRLRGLSATTSPTDSPITPSSTDALGWGSRFPRRSAICGVGTEGGYGTETSQSPEYITSPQARFGSQWTPVKTPPRSVMKRPYQSPSPRQVYPSLMSSASPKSQETTSSGESETSKRSRKTTRSDQDGSSEARSLSSSSSSSVDASQPLRRGNPPPRPSTEMRAAWMLMQLHGADTSRSGKRRRNSYT